MPRRTKDPSHPVAVVLVFLQRFGGALALLGTALLGAAMAFGWRIGPEGITTTAGEVAALRRQIGTTRYEVLGLDSAVRRLDQNHNGLRAEINELRGQVIPLLEAQSRFLCFDNRPVADVAGVPCTTLHRDRAAELRTR